MKRTRQILLVVFSVVGPFSATEAIPFYKQNNKKREESRRENEEKSADILGENQQSTVNSNGFYGEVYGDGEEEEFAEAAVVSSPHDDRGLESIVVPPHCKDHQVRPKYSCLGGELPCVDHIESLLNAKDIITEQQEATQQDTLHRITKSRVLHVDDVPIYHFRQPGRISAEELPFSLMLVSRLDRLPHREIYFEDRQQSEDSWFVGYYWSPIVVCACDWSCTNSSNRTGAATFDESSVLQPEVDHFLHIGWKFTSLDDEGREGITASVEPSFFYALIVQAKQQHPTKDKKLVSAQKVEIMTFKAPGWMVVSLNNGTARVA